MASRLEDVLLRNAQDVFSYSNRVGLDLIRQLKDLRERIERNFIIDQTNIVTEFASEIIVSDIDAAIELLETNYVSSVKAARKNVISEEYSSLTEALEDEFKSRGLTLDTSIPLDRLAILAERPFGGHKLETWVNQFSTRLQRDLKNATAEAIAVGQSPRALATRFRKQFGFRRRGAMALSRTAIMDANNQANREVYEKHSNLITSYTYTATLDSRTCPMCGPNDGLTAEKHADLPQPLLHPNCRCVIRPNTVFSELQPRETVLETETRTVKHRDGSTSTKFKKAKTTTTTKTYPEFFRSQPAEWQKSVLGPSRYKLWKSGQASLGDFANKDRALTLNELKANLRKGTVNRAERQRQRIEEEDIKVGR